MNQDGVDRKVTPWASVVVAMTSRTAPDRTSRSSPAGRPAAGSRGGRRTPPQGRWRRRDRPPWLPGEVGTPLNLVACEGETGRANASPASSAIARRRRMASRTARPNGSADVFADEDHGHAAGREIEGRECKHSSSFLGNGVRRRPGIWSAGRCLHEVPDETLLLKRLSVGVRVLKGDRLPIPKHSRALVGTAASRSTQVPPGRR